MVAELGLYACFDALQVSIRLEAHLNGGNLARPLEEPASKCKVGDNVLRVVFVLFHHETHARREELLLVEALARVVEVDAFAFTGRINLDWIGKVGGKTQLQEKVGAKDAVVYNIYMKLENTVTYQDAVDASELFEAIFHSLDGGHDLAVVNHQECMVFKCFRQDCHIWIVAQRLDFFLVRFHELAFSGYDLQLGIEGGEEPSHHILKSVENGEDAH